jgi:hypothetical protein
VSNTGISANRTVIRCLADSTKPTGDRRGLPLAVEIGQRHAEIQRLAVLHEPAAALDLGDVRLCGYPQMRDPLDGGTLLIRWIDEVEPNAVVLAERVRAGLDGHSRRRSIIHVEHGCF